MPPEVWDSRLTREVKNLGTRREEEKERESEGEKRGKAGA
jgi:hypothetical protein